MAHSDRQRVQLARTVFLIGELVLWAGIGVSLFRTQGSWNTAPICFLALDPRTASIYLGTLGFAGLCSAATALTLPSTRSLMTVRILLTLIPIMIVGLILRRAINTSGIDVYHLGFGIGLFLVQLGLPWLTQLYRSDQNTINLLLIQTIAALIVFGGLFRTLAITVPAILFFQLVFAIVTLRLIDRESV